MEEQTKSTTVNYKPEAISDKVSMVFNKVIDNQGTRVYGKIFSSDVESGSLSLDERSDSLVLKITKFSGLEEEEVNGILQQLPGMLRTILS
ncbi:MAG: hypothetical protein IJZ60_04745 [Bacteroides sp.]|nr:hypothetical protein [Bacteroides sp.]